MKKSGNTPKGNKQNCNFIGTFHFNTAYVYSTTIIQTKLTAVSFIGYIDVIQYTVRCASTVNIDLLLVINVIGN